MRSVWLTSALALCLAAPLLTGCDAIFGDGYEVRITMDKDEYLADPATEFTMTVDNRGDDVVYYLCAGEVFIERFVNGNLAATTGALPNCDCLCPRPIEPGDEEEWKFTVEPFVIEWIETGPNTAGTTFRFRLRLYEDDEFQTELDASDQRSSTFRMVVTD